ncbi:MAG: MBL fold metallo-hydrolase, partial [bacterium]
ISTHDHFDHFNKDIYDFCLKNKIVYLVGTKNEGKDWNYINYESGGLKVYSLGVYHDKKQGKERGLNSIVIIEANFSGKKYKIVHLGDLGHMLNDSQLNKIVNSDVLFIPVGGFFTISSKESVQLIKKARPKIVFPVHYKTVYTQDFPIDDIKVFLDLAKKELRDYEIVKKTDKLIIDEIKGSYIVNFELN